MRGAGRQVLLDRHGVLPGVPEQVGGQHRQQGALGERTDLAELRSFVTAMVQADAFGIPIAQVLRIQAREMRVNLGPAKGKDFATSLGPWIVTADELDRLLGARGVHERQPDPRGAAQRRPA